MYVSAAFEADTQAPKLMQPRIRTFYYPTRCTQTTAVFGTSARDDRSNAPLLQRGTMCIGVVSTVGLQYLGFALRTSYLTRYRRDPVNERKELSDVVIVGTRENGIQRNALRVRDDVVLAARTTAIGWVRSSFFPAPTARTDELSTTAREKSNWSAPRSLANSTSCSRCHTPWRCHCLSRRQQVMPEPHPISLGSISHGMPDFSTNKIPVSTRRLHSGFRPGFRLRRLFFGNNGSISAHKSSSTSGCGIVPPVGYATPHRTNLTRKVQDSFC